MVTRNLKVFIKNGKRYRVVFTSPDKGRATSARKMYTEKANALYYDYIKGHWLVGVKFASVS